MNKNAYSENGFKTRLLLILLVRYLMGYYSRKNPNRRGGRGLRIHFFEKSPGVGAGQVTLKFSQPTAASLFIRC